MCALQCTVYVCTYKSSHDERWTACLTASYVRIVSARPMTTDFYEVGVQGSGGNRS